MKALRMAFIYDAYHRLDDSTKLQERLKPLNVKAKLRLRLFQALYIKIGYGIYEEFE